MFITIRPSPSATPLTRRPVFAFSAVTLSPFRAVDSAQPTVLTGADAEPGGGVYAVQTLDAMRRARGLALSRALSQGPYEAELVPVYSDASPGDEGYRTHVRLGLFTDREAARTAAEQARRTVDARLGVVRVSRAATGPDAPAASASGGEEAAGGDTTAAEGDG